MLIFADKFTSIEIMLFRTDHNYNFKYSDIFDLMSTSKFGLRLVTLFDFMANMAMSTFVA